MRPWAGGGPAADSAVTGGASGGAAGARPAVEGATAGWVCAGDGASPETVLAEGTAMGASARDAAKGVKNGAGCVLAIEGAGTGAV